MERKLTAIVAADVVNYSILIGQDEVGTLTALNTLQKEVITPAVTRFNGRVIRLLGDGSLLAFNSALDAVQFAVDVQRAMAKRKTLAPFAVPIDFRMGANLGDIILQNDDIHGEGINVAVRLEELAPPGGICLSHSIYLQTKNALGEELLPIGERHLKNIAEPVLVWRWQPPGVLDGVGANPGAMSVKRPIHGRQILDPKVTELLVDLYVRSARLAISESFDEMLAEPDGGTALSLQDIYWRFASQLNGTRQALFPISVECGENIRQFTPRFWQAPQSMSEFVANVFDSAHIFCAGALLTEIQAILRSGSPDLAKRTQFMRLVHEFLGESKVPQVKSLIKFAYVDP
jgi:class 3 adenylate cyclase